MRLAIIGNKAQESTYFKVKMICLVGNVNKLSLTGHSFGEQFSLLGVHYHFKLASVHYDKYTKQILAGVRPPFLAMPRFSRFFVHPPLP